MKVSLHTIRQFIDFELPEIDTLVDTINRQLGGVEEVINLGEQYEGAVIVQLKSVVKHPNADRLNICMVDDDGVTKGVERDKEGYVKVVCGAPNVHADMFAVWLSPKVTVPASFHDEKPFVLDTREIRGEISNGMLAAADELAIGSDHSGIVEIDLHEELPSGIKVKPGVSFAKAYGLDDYVIDIENKMFTHRPDLFGQIGIARELFAILQPKPDTKKHSDVRFSSPDTYWKIPVFEKVIKSLPLNVTNNAGENVKRFMCVVMDNVTVGPSPLWLKCALVAMGGKPINNVVDITNYIMLMTAQPAHAYDYDKLRGNTLGVRMAKNSESIKLINGKTYTLDDQDIVIVDGEGPVGLGGIMGGGDSEVSANTTKIVLEVANFDMYAVRKSSMKHGVFTDALARFNKGQSPLQNDRVLYELMRMMTKHASARQASNVTDIRHGIKKQYDEQSINGAINVSSSFINERLGMALSSEQIGNILRLVEFAAFAEGSDKNELSSTAPFWRTDIEIPEDIVEEVGRLYGFDALPRELPKRTLTPAARNSVISLKHALRDRLWCAGANEILTYSFVHEKILKNVGQDTKYAYKISNALSPDLQYYRLSLTPSLLDKIHMNSKAGYDEFALYEINKVHFKGEMDENDPHVPHEDQHLAFVIANSKKTRPSGAAYYQVKRYLQGVIGVKDATLVPLADFDLKKDVRGAQLVAPYEPSRSCVVARDNQIWGVVGEFNEAVTKAFKLPDYAAGFEIHLDVANQEHTYPYQPLSKYPSVTQDISLKVSADTSYEDVYDSVTACLGGIQHQLAVSVTPVNVYQSDKDMKTKTVSLRIVVTSYDRTLTDKDVNKLLDAIEKHTASTVNAVRV